MDTLPKEIRNKIKYFVLEHPIATIYKNNVDVKISIEDNKTWIEIIVSDKDFSTSEQVYDDFDQHRLIMIENKIQYYKILNNFIHKNHNNKTILQIFNEFIQSQTIIRPDITFIGFFNFMSLFGYESSDGLFRLYTDDNRATINSYDSDSD
jgi:hypothetical protein